jgi:hypothetical protein
MNNLMQKLNYGKFHVFINLFDFAPKDMYGLNRISAVSVERQVEFHKNWSIIKINLVSCLVHSNIIPHVPAHLY